MNYQVHSLELVSSVRQRSPISPFSINFIISELMVDALDDLRDARVEMANVEKLCDLDYLDDLVSLFGSTEDAQCVLNRLSRAVVRFGASRLQSLKSCGKAEGHLPQT